MLEADAVAFVQRVADDNIAFVGISGRAIDAASDAEYTGFLQQNPWVDTFPHLLDPESLIWSKYDVSSTPTLILIDEHGSAERLLGRHDPLFLQERVFALVG